MKKLGPRRGRLTVEMHQVGQDGFSAQLAKHGGYLSAMVASVIDDMLQRLPHRIAVHPKVHGLIFDYTIQILLP